MDSERKQPGRVIFSHGHESGPEGNKIRALSATAEAAGWLPEAIDYRDLRDDPPGRVERLLARLDELSGAVVLAGSSLGGYVAMAAAERRPVAGLWLMAPALFLEDRVPGGVPPQTYRPQTGRVMIVHGWADGIIPWKNSLRFAESAGAALHLLAAGHRLEGVIRELQGLLGLFLEKLDPGHG